MDSLVLRWRAFVDFCRHPALPYEKVRGEKGQHAAFGLPQIVVCRPACCHPPTCCMQFNPSGDMDAPNKRLYAALAAEFLGLMFFQLCE